MKSKPILEVITGVPIPGQYDDLKGIDLYGDGEVFNQEDSKKEKKFYSGTLSQKIAKKTSEFKSFESPIFLDNSHRVMSFETFIALYGEIIDSEGYDLITEMYQINNNIEYDEQSYLFQMCESATDKNSFSIYQYPIILEAMKKPATKTKIHNLVSSFINRNIDALSVRYPSSNIMFTQSDIDIAIRIANIDKTKVAEIVSKMLDGLDAKTEFKSISKSPHQVICTAMLMAATEIGDKELINDLITLIAFTMYPLIFRKYFPVTDPNSMAMEEAVTTASQKFYISRTKNLLEWVRILTEVPYKFYKDKFSEGVKSDLLYIHFLNRLRNTMNQQFKSLYAIYKKAYDKKSISTLSDEEYVTLSNNTDKIQIYTMGITTYIADVGYKANVCKAAATYSKTPQTTIEKYIKEYMSDHIKYGLDKLVQNILTIYFNIGEQEEFLSVALKQYPKIWSNKSKIYNEPKEYLDWLESRLTEFDESYLHRYTFGIYIYFAILINIAMNNVSNKLVSINSSKVDSNSK